MFYSHEILTNRKYGVATVWLVATLGSKSVLRKVSRKAIIGVNVPKACETIIQPEAPMALRLQSNLLYGVSRVYSQQCSYILADTQDALNTLRTLLHSVKHDELDPLAGKARPDQLVLVDDPDFMPYMALPALDFDFSKLGLGESILGGSQGSMLSPHSRRDSSTSGGDSLLGLVIPGSDMGGSGYQLPLNDAFQLGGSSIQKTSAIGLFENEEEALIEDFDFEFDADGKIRDIDAAERDLIRSGSVLPRLSRLETDSAASRRVRLDHHEEALVGPVQGAYDLDGDLFMQLDNEFVLPDAEPFISVAGARRVQVESDASTINPTELSSISAEAPLKKRKRKALKLVVMDRSAEFPSANLKSWNENYLQNMDTAIHLKQTYRAPFLARKSAHSWVFGNGLGGVGNGIGSSKLPSPLGMFSGDNLIAAIAGVLTAKPIVRTPKRSHDDDGDESETRRVRARQDVEEQVGRGGEEDGFVPVFDESLGTEAARDAHSALADHTVSAMPWNISSSVHSYRNLLGPGSSSAHGHGLLGGRQSSILSGRQGRLTSASPLIGRGQTSIADLERLDDLSFPLHEPANPFDVFDSADLLPLTDTQVADEFEMFGPTVAVDTQTAQDSQWIKEALEKESVNFLGWVQNTLEDLKTGKVVETVQRMESIEDAEEHEYAQVRFETMINPEVHNRIVAAQAFHHVLTLATKNLLWVEQMEPFADIWMGVKGEQRGGATLI